MNIIICGTDRIGKTSLIKRFLQDYPSYKMLASGKPKATECMKQLQEQSEYFSYYIGKMNIPIAQPIIWDRFHLGECVYGPLYRKYDADYIFNLEQESKYFLNNTLLVLLVINNIELREDDGQSFNHLNATKEQRLFIKSFERSSIVNKYIISVDFKGKFLPKEVIYKNFETIYRNFASEIIFNKRE